MDDDLIACCGFTCNRCPAHRNNIRDYKDQIRTGEGWRIYFEIDLPPEKIICDGCRSEKAGDAALPEKDCPIRMCVSEKRLENCSCCGQYPCSKLQSRLESVDDVIQKFKGIIPEQEYNKFIEPYNARRTLDELRHGRGRA